MRTVVMFGTLVAAMLAATTAHAQQITLKPGAIAGVEAYEPKARDYAYCEIAPVLVTLSNVVAEFYNTTATKGPTGGCPHKAFIAIDPENLAAALKVDEVYLNPTPRTARRHWVMDELTVYKTGETVDFFGVAATWMASMSPEQMRATLKAPYTPVEIHRESKYLYKKGGTVFLLRAREGKAWVMQSYATEVDKNLSYAQLPKLGSMYKTLPAGLKFEVKTLPQDLTIEPTRANGVAHIIRDEFHDMYEGCGYDANAITRHRQSQGLSGTGGG